MTTKDLEAEKPSWEKEETDERFIHEGCRRPGEAAGSPRSRHAPGGSAGASQVRGVPRQVGAHGRAASPVALPLSVDAGAE